MNIEKEGELFEQWWEDEGQYHRAGGDEYCKTFAWESWIFAKSQAVSEGLKKFCNDHKDPAWRGRLTEYDKGYSDCCIAVLEMIEAAQE